MTSSHFDIIDQFRSAMADAGVPYGGTINADTDKIQRFDVDGDRRNSRTGFYLLHTDGVPAGEFGCWKRGIQVTWCAKTETTLTPDERKALLKKREADRLRREALQREMQAAAARAAVALWEASDEADDGHPYLERKGVRSHGLRVGTWTRSDDNGDVWLRIENALLVPVRRGSAVVSMQAIFADKNNPLGRDKDFISGGEKRGCYFAIGKPDDAKPVIVICEGYATGASIYEATGYAVVVAFDAGNLETVAVRVRDKFPYARIIVAADNDRWTTQPVENPGVHFGRRAAEATRAELCVPEFSDLDGKPTDFNDLHQRQGLAAVAALIDPPPVESAPAPANDNDANLVKPIDIFAEFPAPPLRTGMLPAVIEDYAAECGELIGVDPSMVAIPALVACAAAIHDGIRVQPKRHESDWTESARLWCAIVGNPSVKKSPAISRATRRLRKISVQLAEQNGKALADYNQQLDDYKEGKKADRKRDRDYTPQPLPMPEKPQIQRIIVEDITVEALSDVLMDNPRGVLCIQDELSGWFGSMDAYNGGKSGSKDRAAWLQAYNGGFRDITRVLRGNIGVPNFSVSMIGGIQPDAIRRIAKDMTDDGLMQRFMIVIGRNDIELDRPPNTEVGNAYAAVVDKLFSLVPTDRTSVTLSDDAHEIRIRLKEYAEELAGYPALPGGLRSHLGKWTGLFARLLLTYHVIECATASVYPTERKVSGETAARVDKLMRDFLLPHAMAYYTDILGASGELEHARWVAGFALSRGLTEVTNRDLVQAYKQWRGMDDWQRTRVMQVLEDMGWCSPVMADGVTTRRKATSWAINPLVHSLFADKASQEAERRQRIREEVSAMQRRARE